MRKFARFGAVLAFGMLFCAHVPCQAPNCKEPNSTPEERACAQLDFQAADEHMQRVFRQVLNKYAQSEGERASEARMDKLEREEAVRYRTVMHKELQASQTAWLSYRDAACSAVLAKYEYGTLGPVAATTCKTDLTRERTKFLRTQFLEF